MEINSKIIILAMSMALAIAGCSDEDDEKSDSSSPETSTIQGTASKGIVIGGTVTADELNSDSTVKNASVGSATTDNTGAYSLTLTDAYEGGPIRITVSNNTNTTMVCDAVSGCGTANDASLDNNPTNGTVDFGEQYKPSNLSMSALIADADDGETIDVQVTPFTHMALERAKESGNLNADSINQANSEVSDLLGGIDILRTQPIDITNLTGDESADAITYASFSAAVAESASDGSNEPDLSAAIDELASNFSGGKIATGDLQEIITQAEGALDEVGALDTTGIINEIQDAVDDAIAAGGDVDPEANENAGDSDVELAKAFLTDLRTWNAEILNEAETPISAFDEQLEASDEIWDFIQDDDDVDAIAAGIEAMFLLYNGEINSGSLVDLETEFGTFTEGTIASASTSDGQNITISNATVSNNQGGTASLEISFIIPEDGSTVSQIKLGIQSLSVNDGIESIVSDSGIITVDLGEPYVLNFDDDESDVPEIDSLSFELNATITRLKTVENDLLVDATNSIVFVGDVAFSIDISISEGVGEGGLGIELSMASFELDGSINNNDNSYDVNFAASIPNLYSNEESSPQEAHIGLQFTAQLDNLPKAHISITGNATDYEDDNAADYDQGNVNLTISYGTRSLSFDVSNDTEAGEIASITITNQDGLELIVSGDSSNEEELSVTLNDKVIATIINLNGSAKVEYIDGTFEIF